GIADVDTRAVVRHIRDRGAMKAGIFSGADLADDESMLATVRAQEAMAGASLSREVTTDEAYVVEPEGTAHYSVAALDLGIKTNTPRMLAARGVRVHVIPAGSTLQDVLELDVDGVFLSNGPGDPAAADDAVHLTKEVLGQGIPFFGICFGNQILGRADSRATGCGSGTGGPTARRWTKPRARWRSPPRTTGSRSAHRRPSTGRRRGAPPPSPTCAPTTGRSRASR